MTGVAQQGRCPAPLGRRNIPDSDHVAPPTDASSPDTLVYVVDVLATADVTLDPAGTEGQAPATSPGVERPTDTPTEQ